MTRASLVALLPRAGALTEDTLVHFEKTSLELGLAPQRLASGAALAIRGPAGVAPSSAIVGEVFAPPGAPSLELGALCERLDQDGRVLPDRGYWGDYLTLASDAGAASYQLDRAPFGNLPCFWIKGERQVLAATSATLLEAYSAVPLAVDWRGLAIYLLSPQMRSGSTCLEGLRELPPGASLVVGRGQVAVRWNWSPWEFARPAQPFETLEEAAHAVAEAVDRAVAARCTPLQNPVLLLSGGLDSSTIAASLFRARVSFSALTMVTRHKSGDERVYARAVAHATGAPLRECLRSTADVDWTDQTPRRLVRPYARLFRQPTLRAAHRQAIENGGDTIIDGGGGDDLFCSLNSVVPLLDRVAIEGWGRGTWQTARDIALRADVDLMTVIRRAVRRRLSRRIAFRWPTVTDFLAPDVQSLADEAVRHPWLDPPTGTLPGQAAHVALVLDALGLSEDDSIDPSMRTVSPLVAQPVVEASLRVRSWLWFETGRNRAVIRRGFSSRLPEAVIERTGKGTPGGFIAEIVEKHRSQLREALLGGVLVANGLADPVTIATALAERATLRDDRYGHLLVLADAERWARLWH